MYVTIYNCLVSRILDNGKRNFPTASQMYEVHTRHIIKRWYEPHLQAPQEMTMCSGELLGHQSLHA